MTIVNHFELIQLTTAFNGIKVHFSLFSTTDLRRLSNLREELKDKR